MTDSGRPLRISASLILALLGLGIAVYAAVVANGARERAEESERYARERVNDMDARLHAVEADLIAYKRAP